MTNEKIIDIIGTSIDMIEDIAERKCPLTNKERAMVNMMIAIYNAIIDEKNEDADGFDIAVDLVEKFCELA